MAYTDDVYLSHPMYEPYNLARDLHSSPVIRHNQQVARKIAPRKEEILKEITHIHNSLDMVVGFKVMYNKKTDIVNITFNVHTLKRFFMSNYQKYAPDYKLKIWSNLEQQVLLLNEQNSEKKFHPL